ncbi:mitochondrial inner membrane protein OXA1L [Ceratina calcarata]|uniref:Mitochondrial inner membrane protein OXA1L n=1 Tax=Ceratina calcarata TaxID=156304 RepID=A0AAJ7ISL9_9HYME|nr:mitochondrial inner membrane protein OXA1L [Ceratina calcarata]
MLPRLPVHIGRKLLNKTLSIQKITECQFSRLACNSMKGPLKKDLLFNIHDNSKVCGFCLVRYESTVNTTVKESIARTSSSSPVSSTPASSTPVSSTPVSSTPVSSTPVSSTPASSAPASSTPASSAPASSSPVSSTPTSTTPVSNTASDSATLQTQEVAATSTATPAQDLLNEIPDPPVPIPEQIVEAIKLSANGEPTFESLGLGGWGPVGLLQWYFEWLHVTFDMPWWAAIVATSVLIKIITFPLTLDVQKNNAKLQNVLPQMVQIQTKLTEARNAGNVEEAALYAYELQTLLKNNEVKIMPTSNFIRLGVHVPIFIALRGMTNLPVESLKHGGIYWFTDLTVPDPYYILPLCTSVSMFFVAEYAMKNASSAKISPILKYLMRGLPIISFLFGMRFPGAVLCHWVTSNFITIAQNEALKKEKVKKYFNIPAYIKHPEMVTSDINKKKSFSESFNDSWANMKLSNKLAQHARADRIQFNRAGKGLVQKTYKFNPKATTMSAVKK